MPNLVPTRGRALDRRKVRACNLPVHRARVVAVAVALASMTYVGSVMVASATGPRIHSNAEYLIAVRQAVGFASGPVHDSGWVAYHAGGVAAYGGTRRLGPAPTGFGPVKGIASNPKGRGFWLFNADGRVAAFGNARTHSGPMPLTTTVGMISSATGHGYLLLDGPATSTPMGTPSSTVKLRAGRGRSARSSPRPTTRATRSLAAPGGFTASATPTPTGPGWATASGPAPSSL